MTAPPSRIAVAGASGLIGTTLVAQLRAAGTELIRLVRRPAAQRDERQWDPRGRWIDGPGLSDADAVICLSGAGIAARPWTRARRAELRSSRLDPVQTVVEALPAAPRCQTFLSGSAVGFYGDRGEEGLTEDAAAGAGFLPDLVTEWEAVTHRAPSTVRTVLLRTSLVLASSGGLLGSLRPLFAAGLGGRLGSGRQWMPWITVADHVRAQRHLLESELSGPVNLCTPAPVRNTDFTKALAGALRRPAILPVPLAPLRLAVGADFVNELVAVSQRVVPKRLLADGFEFEAPDLRGALEKLVE